MPRIPRSCGPASCEPTTTRASPQHLLLERQSNPDTSRVLLPPRSPWSSYPRLGLPSCQVRAPCCLQCRERSAVSPRQLTSCSPSRLHYRRGIRQLRKVWPPTFRSLSAAVHMWPYRYHAQQRPSRRASRPSLSRHWQALRLQPSRRYRVGSRRRIVLSEHGAWACLSVWPEK